MLKPDVVIVLADAKRLPNGTMSEPVALFHPCSPAAKQWANEVFKAYPSWRGTPASPAFALSQADNIVDTLTERGLRVFVF